MMQSVKIMGSGVLSPLGASVPEVFRHVCRGERAWREIRQFDASAYARGNCGVLAEEVDCLLEERYSEMSRASAFCCFAGEQALRGVAACGRRLLVLASNFGQMLSRQWCWRERMDTGVISEESHRLVEEAAHGIAARLGCFDVVEVTNSCSSGLVAMAVAKDWIACGRAEEVLLIGYDEITEFSWGGLTALHTVTAGEMMPFDARRSGTVFSEGAAALLLCGEAHAGEPLAWLSGCATGNNAFHITAPCVDGAGSAEVMEGALRDAELVPEAVSAVVAHATSTVGNDRTEAAALRRVFGGVLPPVGAWKPFLGHALGAAGLMEAVLALEAMRTGEFPVVRVESPDAACGIQGQGLPAGFRLESILVNSAGIGGNNAAVLLTRSVCHAAPRSFPVRGAEPSPGTGEGGRRVVGYQDPAETKLLAGLRKVTVETPRNPRRGIVVHSRSGCLKSAWEFYCGLVKNGPRRASPMLFPHTYTNMPGCLGAIEFGCAGPHATFTGGASGEAAAREFAHARIADGSADEMILVCMEEPFATAVPDGLSLAPRLEMNRLCRDAPGA